MRNGLSNSSPRTHFLSQNQRHSHSPPRDNLCLFSEYSNQVTQGIREGTWDTINTLKFRASPGDDGSEIRCVVIIVVIIIVIIVRCVAEHRALKHRKLERKIDLTVYCEYSKSHLVTAALMIPKENQKEGESCFSTKLSFRFTLIKTKYLAFISQYVTAINEMLYPLHRCLFLC